MPEFEIAIVGGGISGLVLAIALQARSESIPARITIYEQAPHFGEIGAGVAFSPNAIRAMRLCSPAVYAGFENVATTNQSLEKATTWFDFLDGFNDHPVGQEKWLFNLSNPTGSNAVHRAHFLDELVKVVPEGTAKFNKRLGTIHEQGQNGKLRMTFHDGSEAEADAIIGCDGIKSRVRAVMFGNDHPSTHPVYTHKYAYRGLIPIEKARKTLGDDLASNAKMHLGKDGHVLTFPVAKGKMMNVVAFKTNPDPWPTSTKLTMPSKKEHVYKDFAQFGPTVKAIIDLLDENLDIWAIFDLGDHPLPTYTKGKICLVGDAAHATSPHLGAGAGFCIEDAAVMAELLADLQSRGVSLEKGIVPAFQAFDRSRRERTHWLVQTSRRRGDLYEWRADGVGEDIESIAEECRISSDKQWNAEMDDMVNDSKMELSRLLDDGVSNAKSVL